MKKTILPLLLIFVFQQIFSQAVNEPGNWPNASWELNGTFEAAVLLGDPTIDSNFGFDDFDAGDSSVDNLLAESPVIDVSSAVSGGENFLILNSTFNFLFGDVGDRLTTQYWDEDAGVWVNWGNPIDTSTADVPSFEFCDGPFVAFVTDELDISSFSTTQLLGFRYRINYDDGGGKAGGFCMNSPTLISTTGPAACADITGLNVTNVTANSADVNWTAGNAETAWEIAVQTQGTGVPSGSGQSINTNPHTENSLTASTAYEVYVRANCLTNGFSNWVGPINFTTRRMPPATPVGVSCSTGSSSIIFSEEFGLVEEEAPLGWTGTGFDGDEFNGGDWSITESGTNTPGTGPLTTWDNNLNPGVHLEYETEGNAVDIARAITPPIDMLAAEDGAELSFYMHAYGAAIGTLNIGVSNSPTGPFTNVFSWTGELQTSDTDAWVPVGVNLDAYLGQIIYLEFAYGGNGTSDAGDLSLDAIRVESCGDFCIMPDGLEANNIMTTSADISWTSNGTEANWEYVVQPAGTGLPSGSGSPATSTSITETGLTPATLYEVYVRANCLTDGFSLWFGPIQFTTLATPPPPPVGVNCASGTLTEVFTEDFGLIENMDPAGWTGTGFSGNIINGNWRITNANDNTASTGPLNSWDSNPGVHLEYEGSGNSTNVATAITPAIDLTSAGGGAELSFYLHAFGASIGELNVGVSLSPTGPFNTVFTWTGGLQISDADAWFPVGINLDGAIGQVFYVQFSYGGPIGSDGTSDLAIDQIKIESCLVACAAPSNLAASNITTNSVDLSWTPNAGEANWEYVVQPSGTGIPAGSGITASSSTVNVNALTAATGYEVYVRANCLADGFSEWVGPINFSTLNNMPPPPPVGVNCVTGTSTTAFEENFGLTQNTDPSGWTGTGFNGNSVNGNWRITNPGTNAPNSGPLNSWDGNPGVHLEYEASGSATTIASAITPAIDLSTAVDGAELSFYMHAFGSGIGALSIGVSTSASGPFTTEYSWSGPFQTNDSDAWIPVGVNLDSYLGQTIFIEFSYGGNGNSSDGDIALDAIVVESCGNFCLTPSNLEASNITLNSADISWDAGGSETNWEYVLQAPGIGLPTGNGIATTTTTVNLNALTPVTEYEVYVRANCLTAGFSNWVGPIVFETLKIPPPVPVGVDCSAGGTQGTIFTETFGTTANNAPLGWTGTGFDGHITTGNWRISNPNVLSPETGPLNSWDGNSGVHLEYEASNNQTNIARAITPMIDMTESVNNAELSFYMHAYGNAIGILNIGVSTTATGPFTNVFTWDGQLQGTDADEWAHVGVNLDAYLGQTIYIEFAYGGEGSNINGDLALDQINIDSCSVTPPTCIEPSGITVTNITDTSVDISWTANNGETEWEYVVVPSGTPPPASGTTVLVPNATETGLSPVTEYDVYVLANCSATLESVWAGPIPFTTLDVPPTCIEPSGITVTNITDTSVDISWTANNGETEWEYVVVPSGTPPPASGTTVLVPNATETGLSPVTEYDVYVLANCSATLESEWAGPIPFTTIDVATCTIPTAGIVDDITTCDDSSGDGIEAFNLGSQTATILGTQDPGTIIVTYHDTLSDAQNGVGALTPIFIASNGTEIFVRVEDTTIPGSTCVNTSTKFTLFISGTIPDVLNPSDLRTCDDVSRDGFEFFDLTSNTLPILGSLSPADYTVIYYASQTDAQTQMNPLSSPYENVSNPQTIYARVSRVGTTDCFKIVDFDLIVNDIPEISFDSSIDYEICPDTASPITITAFPVNFIETEVAIQWYFEGEALPGETALELASASEIGRYSIIVTFNGTRCSSETDIIVTESANCSVPQGISPNGDGFNDSFDLSSFDVESLEIYNRSGTLVYSKKDYLNEWKGQSNAGDELPVGTYYYIMKFKGDQVKSAWVYINK